MASTVVLAAALVGRCELPRLAISFAVPGAVFRGGCQAVYVCRLVRLPLRTYVARAWLPALLNRGAAAPLALALGVRWHQPDTWPQLFAYGATFTAGSCSAPPSAPRARPCSQVDPVRPPAPRRPRPEWPPEPASLLVEDKPRTLDPQAS